MSEWKYIVFDTPDHDEVLVFFPPYIEHFAMCKALNGPVVAAGFLHYNEIEKKIFCHGKSVGLGIETRGAQDTRLASKFLDW